MNIVSIKIKITKYEFIFIRVKKINFNLLVSSMIKILTIKIFVPFFSFFLFLFSILILVYRTLCEFNFHLFDLSIIKISKCGI